MKQSLSIEDQAVEDVFTDRSDLRYMLDRLDRQAPMVSAADRWGQLRQRIVAYQALQTLTAHISAHQMELQSATLLLRPWSCITVPIM